MKPEMNIVPLRDIATSGRYRKDLGDIDELAKSIQEVGLLSFPMIRTDGVLVHGYRRLQACKKLGWTEIPVIIFDPEDALRAEHDENEFRKSFTHSERVAIGQAIEEKIGSRKGSNQHKAKELVENFPQAQKGEKTRDVAAKAAGFGNAKTYQQAETVVEKGIEPLVHAMDAGTVSINAAAELAKETAETQQEVLQKGPEAVKQHAKQKREERKAKPAPKPLPSPIPQEKTDNEDEEDEPTEEDIFERQFAASLKEIDDAVQRAIALKDDPEQRMRIKAHLNFCNSLIQVFKG
jgi:ParB family chromosome partitioning protein